MYVCVHQAMLNTEWNFRWHSTINKQQFSFSDMHHVMPHMIFVENISDFWMRDATDAPRVRISVFFLQIDEAINLSDAEYHFSIFTFHPRHDEMPEKSKQYEISVSLFPENSKNTIDLWNNFPFYFYFLRNRAVQYCFHYFLCFEYFILER